MPPKNDDEKETIDVINESKDKNVITSLTNISITNNRTQYEEVQHLRELSWVLDDAIPIPGTNRSIGFDVVIGILPIAGDTISTAYSSYIIYKAYQIGVPARVLVLLIGNVVTDSFISLFPGFGTIADCMWKCNQRNVTLIEQYYTGKPITRTQALKTITVASLPILTVLLLTLAIIGMLTNILLPYI